MKFLCVDCDQQMAFGERELPGDGTLAATFKCPSCGRVVALLTNPMETQLVFFIGSRDRRQDRAGAAPRNRPYDGRDRPGRCI